MMNDWRVVIKRIAEEKREMTTLFIVKREKALRKRQLDCKDKRGLYKLFIH